MAKLTVTVRGTGRNMATKAKPRKPKPKPSPAARPRQGRGLELYAPGVGLLRLPFLPDSIQLTDLGDTWTDIPRPGRRPLLVREGVNNAKMTFAVELWDGGGSILDQQADLRRLAKAATPVVVSIANEAWRGMRITGLAVTHTAWDNPDGRPTRGTADLELTEASDAAAVIGPVVKVKGKGRGMAK